MDFAGVCMLYCSLVSKYKEEKTMSSKKIGIVIALVSGLLYGLMPLVTKTVYAGGSNSFTVAFLRMGIGTGVFCILFRLTSKEKLGVTAGEFKQLLICSCAYAFTPVLLYTAYNHLASGLATTLHFVYPVFVVLGSILFRIEKLTKKKVLCCALCMAGIVSFYTPGGEISLTGILIALASGAVYAFYAVYLAASDLLSMDLYKLSFWKHLIGMAVVGICAIFLKKISLPGTPIGWTLMLLLGLLTAAASLLYQQATKLAGAQETAMLSTFEPLTSVIVGYLVYSEQLTIKNIAGIICILLSVILLSTGEKVRKS